MQMVLLARHGETDANVQRVFQGQSGIGLNALGRRQARFLGERFRGQLMLALETAGRYARESRDWRPHVTVGRFRTPPRLRLSPPPVAPFAAADLALYESTSSPAGSSTNWCLPASGSSTPMRRPRPS